MCSVQRVQCSTLFFSSLHSFHGIDFGCLRLSFCSIFLFLLFILQNFVWPITFVEYSFTWAINYEFHSVFCLSMTFSVLFVQRLICIMYFITIWSSCASVKRETMYPTFVSGKTTGELDLRVFVRVFFSSFALLQYWSPFKNFIRLLSGHLN